MTQVTPATPPRTAPSPSFASGITDQIQNILSHDIVKRIVELVADPLSWFASPLASVPVSIGVTFYFQPYLLLDPTTTLVGIGVAVAVNALALYYFTPLIQAFWADYWEMHHIVPEVVASPSNTSGTIPTPTITPMDPLAKANEAYQSAVKAYDQAVHRLKKAKANSESVGQGQKDRVETLRAKMLLEKGQLLKYAEEKRSLIQDLIRHQEILSEHCQSLVRLIGVIPEQLKPADSNEAVLEAISLLNVDLDNITTSINRTFDDIISLFKDMNTSTPSNVQPKNTISENVLKEDRQSLIVAQNTLKKANDNKTKIEEREILEKTDNTRRQSELDALGLQISSTVNVNTTSKLKTVQDGLKKAEEEHAKKIDGKKALLKSMEHLVSYGSSQESRGLNARVNTGNRFQLKSKTALVAPLIKENEIQALKKKINEWERDEITPAAEKVFQARDQLASVEADKTILKEEIKTSAQTLDKLSREKQTVISIVSVLEEEITYLKKRIHLVEEAEKLKLVMATISKRLLSPFKTIVRTYQGAEQTYNFEKGKQSGETESTNGELIAARKQKKELATEKQKAFSDLTIEKAKQFNTKIQTLRGARYRKIVERSETIQAFYDHKVKAVNGTLHSTDATAMDQQCSKIQSLSLEVLEEKIAIAAATIEMHSFSIASGKKDTSDIHLEIDKTRIRLAEHRLKRHQIEENWRVFHKEESAHGERATSTRPDQKVVDELKKVIADEQLLVFQYYTLKLSRDGKDNNKHAAKAIFAVLGLILDRISLEATLVKQQEKFNTGAKIKEYFEEVMKSPHALVFNQCAQEKQDATRNDSTTILARVFNWGGTDKKADVIPVSNPFVDKLMGELTLDLNTAATVEQEAREAAQEQNNHNIAPKAAPSSQLTLPKFFDEVNIQSEHLHPPSKSVIAMNTPTTAMIGSKITLIQLALTKPLPSNDLFIGKYKEKFLPAKREYQRDKYVAKAKLAVAQKARIENKDDYKTAMGLKAAEETRAQEALNATRDREIAATTAQAAATAAQGARDRAIVERNETIQSYAWVEKLSYLVPAAALWALYRLSPLLEYISLSLRVSQNILLIGAATDLFIQCLFRNVPATETSRPLSPDRVTAA